MRGSVCSSRAPAWSVWMDVYDLGMVSHSSLSRAQVSRSWMMPMPADGSGLWLAAHAPTKLAATDAGLRMTRALQKTWVDMPAIDSLPRLAILGFIHLVRTCKLEELPFNRRAREDTR